MRRRRAAGFTLIELMIVIAIVAIIAAIAIPNLLEARKRSHESSAIHTLRSLVTAQQLFKDRDMDRNGVNDYAVEMARLCNPPASLLALQLNSHTGFYQANGYYFFLTSPAAPQTSLTGFRCAAIPLDPKAGDYSYVVDETGVIRFVLGSLTTSGFLGLTISTLQPVGG